MSELADFWPRLVLAVLATWRLSHLLVHEEGPGGLAARLRAALAGGFWGRSLGCLHCTSLWVAAPLSLWVAWHPVELPIVWLAISGAACLCDRLGEPPLLIETVPDSRGEPGDGVLRTKT